MTELDRTKSVELPADVVSRVEKRVRLSDFDTADEYIEYVVEEVLFQIESAAEPEDGVSKVDESVIEERLEALGYLNE